MLCVFMVEGMSVGVNVMLSLMSIRFRGELGFLNCDDVCMRVFDESFELLEFVVYAVYGNLQNDEISLVITARFVSACGVCSVCSPNCLSRVKIWNNPVHVVRLCG